MLDSSNNAYIKNVIIVSIAFFLEFTAFAGIANLQSSLNNDLDDAVGTTSLAVIYGSIIVSSILLPSIIIEKIGLKFTLMASLCAYVTYTLANFYPSYYTLIPTAVLLGLAGAPLWSAKCAYVTTAAQKYSKLTNEPEETVVTRFFGIFFFFFQLTQISGNLISSLVLSDLTSNGFPKFEAVHNQSYILSYCGSNNCNKQSFDSPGKNDPKLAYILMTIYSATGVGSILFIWWFLDDMKMTTSTSVKTSMNPKQLLWASIKHLVNDKRQQCIIFITMYSGFKQAFLTGDFTNSFINCPLGINWIGFVLMSFGAVNAICSFSFGRLSGQIGKNTSRGFLIGLALGLDLMAYTSLLLWNPQPENSWFPFFWFPIFFGVSDAVIQTQVNAIYGAFFADNQDAAFSNYRLWESVGFVIPFAYQPVLCVSTKLYVNILVVLLALIFYLLCEKINLTMKLQNDRFEEKDSLKSS